MTNCTKFFILICCIWIVLSILFAGCVNYSAKNTVLSANEVINSFNTLIDQQQSFNIAVQYTLAVYNSEMLKQNKNYALLYSNIQSDITTIDSFTPYLDDINIKIINYSGQTTNLNGDVKQYADQSLVKMRAQYSDWMEYQSDMKEFEQDLKSYIDSVSAGSPDASLLKAANDAKDRANAAIARANIESADLNDLMKKIAQSQ